MAWVFQPSITNDCTFLANKGPSSLIIRRITNHCLLCDPLENHFDVLLCIAPHSGCINGFCNPLENRCNLKNLANHGINILNLFMLHTTPYKLVTFYWLCAHGKTWIGIHELKWTNGKMDVSPISFPQLLHHAKCQNFAFTFECSLPSFLHVPLPIALQAYGCLVQIACIWCSQQVTWTPHPLFQGSLHGQQ